MDLESAMVSSAISIKAGPELQKICNELPPLEQGDVVETPSYDMETCKKIIHCSLPKWKSGNNTGPVCIMYKYSYRL